MSFNNKQKTLFQSWNCKPTSSKNKVAEAKKNVTKHNNDQQPVSTASEIITDDDVDDDDLLSAAAAFEHATLYTETQPLINTKDHENLPGFDNSSGNLWIYPTNYPVRDYQFSITQTALFKNTLVALPTGLGKTFIAAVVLYNFYRWYPQGKVVFMAPTKPLVSQQIEACYNIMGIPMEDQVQITGATMVSNRRAELWSSKRVFFLTPQVINNDLAKGVCPASLIKCVVIDEAHKALGNHAYCQVIQQLLSYTRNFRVLALSATPGSDLKSVQQVIKNLLVSTIELRSEEAIDIRQYTHARSVDKVVVKLSDQIIQMRQKYFAVIQIFINVLVNNKVIYNKDVTFLSKYALLMARDQFRKDPPSGLPKSAMGTLEGTFAISISLYHGLELLLQHGMKSFFIFLKGIMKGGKGNMRSKAVLQANPQFQSIYSELTGYFGESPDSIIHVTQHHGTQQSTKQPNQKNDLEYVYSHPKMKKLEEVVLQHFQNAPGGSKPNETRVMVFCQYRDIVREITELLQTHRPLVRPMQFVGHAPSTNPNDEEKSGSKNNRRFTQKDQLMVVEKFRSGDYNTLVSTCVGEEGLDIGDVDLIVCFDSHKSPIRLVQRMGRTGRKRNGRIVMLVTEGKEERDYNSSLASRRSIHKAIAGAGRTLQYYPHSPSMIPNGLKPRCHKMFITVPERINCEKKKAKPKLKERKVSTVDVSELLRKCTKSVFLNPEEKEVWRSDLMLSNEETKQLKPVRPIRSDRSLYLEKELWGNAFKKSSSLSLSEWLPWQSRLQRTKHVGHSTRSNMLTEILQLNEMTKESTGESFLCESMTSPDTSSGLANTSVTCQSKKLLKHSGISDKKDGNSHKAERSSKNPKKKEFVIISDDDDFVINDSPCLPSYNTVFLTTAEKSVQEHDKEVNVNMNGENGDLAAKAGLRDMCPKDTSHEGSIAAADQRIELSSIGDGHKNCSEGRALLKKSFSLKFLTDNSLSIAANISALSPSTSEESFKGAKVSKSACDVRLNQVVGTPSSMDTIAFDFFEHSRTSAVEKSPVKQTCFKLWDSDDEVQKMCNMSNADDSHSTANDTAASSSKQQVFETSYLSNSTDQSKENKGSKNNESDSENREESHPPHAKECSLSNRSTITSPCHNKPTLLSPVHLSDVSNDKNSFIKFGNKNVPCLDKPFDDSFDVSADMFAPQFDLDFDFGFDAQSDTDKTIPKGSEVKANADVVGDILPTSENSFANEKPSHVVSTSENHVSIHPHLHSFAKEAETRNQENDADVASVSQHFAPLSPTSLTSFGLSQTKRIENRKLFADLTSGNEHTVPCAKVVPQIKLNDSRKINLAAATIPVSPLVDEKEAPKTRAMLKMKNLKRVKLSKKIDDYHPKIPDDDEDDFQTLDPLKKRIKPDIKALPESDESSSQLILQKRSRKIAILSSDDDYDPVIPTPFKKRKEDTSSSSSHFSPGDCKSPVLTLQSKRSKKFTKSRSSGLDPISIDQVRFGNEATHSTPKQLYDDDMILADDAASEQIQSDDSIFAPKSAKKLTFKKSRAKDGKKMFICDEAEVSVDGREVSSDEDTTDDVMDEEMMNFMNDATQLTQLSDHDGGLPDEQAMYLRSVRSPHFGNHDRPASKALAGRYKLAYNPGNDLDVFSQVPEKDVSDYLEDSFCVGSDECDEVSDLGEVTLLEDAFADDQELRRPSTRGQARCQVPTSNRLDAQKKKNSRKRIIMCEESFDTDVETATSRVEWRCQRCTLINPSSERACRACGDQSPPALGKSNQQSSPKRLCELCGGVLATKGWMCKDCVTVVQMSEDCELAKPSTSETVQSPSTDVTKTFQGSETNSSITSVFSSVASMTRKERLKKSKLRQQELRDRLKLRKSTSLDVTSGDHGKPMPSHASPCPVKPIPEQRINKRLSFDDLSPGRPIPGLAMRPDGPQVAEKLTIILDNREISAGATRLVQELRTCHNVNTQTASLQCCSYVVSNRCAVIRKTVEDIATVSKKQKLAALIKQSSSCYRSLYLIVEKDRVKKGLIGSKSSAAQCSNFVSVIVSLTNAGIKILYSKNQDESAKLLHTLACRKSKAGERIDSKVLKYSSDPSWTNLFNIYHSLPGVSYVSALYLCHYFRSIKEILKSSLDDLVAKAFLPVAVAENILKFFRKPFDIQMTPL